MWDSALCMLSAGFTISSESLLGDVGSDPSLLQANTTFPLSQPLWPCGDFVLFSPLVKRVVSLFLSAPVHSVNIDYGG